MFIASCHLADFSSYCEMFDLKFMFGEKEAVMAL